MGYKKYFLFFEQGDYHFEGLAGESPILNTTGILYHFECNTKYHKAKFPTSETVMLEIENIPENTPVIFEIEFVKGFNKWNNKTKTIQQYATTYHADGYLKAFVKILSVKY